MDTRSGTIIDGRYEFGNTLGKGKGYNIFSKLIYKGYITGYHGSLTYNRLYELTLIGILGLPLTK